MSAIDPHFATAGRSLGFRPLGTGPICCRQARSRLLLLTLCLICNPSNDPLQAASPTKRTSVRFVSPPSGKSKVQHTAEVKAQQQPTLLALAPQEPALLAPGEETVPRRYDGGTVPSQPFPSDLTPFESASQVETPAIEEVRPPEPADDNKPIGQLTINISPSTGTLPENHAASVFLEVPGIDTGRGVSRSELSYSYNWQASAFCHQPLYFEDANLERYGYGYGMAQPVVSGVKFFLTVPILPYKSWIEPPHECIYTLGHYRPGSKVPRQCNWLPLRLDAAAFEAGVITAYFFMIH